MNSRLLLISAVLLASFQTQAITCNEKFECEGSGISKQEIRDLSLRLKNHRFNGKPFDLKAVQKIFKKTAAIENPESGDYRKYWEAQDRFTREYGNSNEARLLFQLAKADYYIKRYEKEHKFKFSDEDRIVTDYRFIGSGRQSYDSPDSSVCILDAKVGKTNTDCNHYAGKSGIGGALLFLATMGHVGDPNGYRREKTACVTKKPIKALVRTMQMGEPVVSAVEFVAEGTAVEFDKNVWFRKGLKVESKKRCELEAVELEERTVLYSCSKHVPKEEENSENLSSRSPAVIEQFGPGLKKIQETDNQ